MQNQENQQQGNDTVSCLQTIIQLLQRIDSKLDAPKPLAEPQIITKEIEVVKEVPVEVIKNVEVTKEIMPQALMPYVNLCQAVTADNAIAELLIARNHSEISDGEKLPRLLANAAQWDKIVALRELLGARCKTEQRPANATENAILAECIKIHNFTFNDQQASLVSEEIGANYDLKKHERGTPSGETVSQVWLAGLRSAGDILVKKVLVGTN